MSDEARLLADDPRTLFGSARTMFAVPYPEIRELQLAALNERFRELRPRVQLLDRLAQRNDVEGIDSIADGARLLYPSNVYKSYPFGWLVDEEYGRLTNWLRQLTAHDLSTVDLAGVDSLDEWFTRLEAASDLRLCHSSSTSGKLSFVPRGVDEWMRRSASLEFSNEAAGLDSGPEHVSFDGMPFISTFYRTGHSAILMHTDWFIRAHTDPDGTHPERVLTLHPGALSSDLMVIAGRLRSGQLTGDPRSMQLPQRMLERRGELDALLDGTTGDRIDQFVTEAADRFRGQRVLVEGVWPSMVDIDKIVAWGGIAAIRHVASYAGPGVELIALDPKISISLLGAEVVGDAEARAEGARRLAVDVGMMNQEACVSSRIAFVEVGGLDDPEPGLRAFADKVFEELQRLPASQSTPVDRLPDELRDEVEAALLLGEPEVVGGGTGAGGVLISWDGRPVDYSASLAARYLNIVPVARLDDVLERVSSTTQTCGVFPVALREQMRDALALAGVQRVATLGTAAGGGDHQAIPQDGMEVLRRMCRWIVDEGDRKGI